MIPYHGFVSRAAFLEDLRQQSLEIAEALEHRWGADSPVVKYAHARAAELLALIADERAKEAK